MRGGLKILAVGGIGFASEQAMQDLRPLVRQACGKTVRRTNRFIDLALIGAHRCVAGQPLHRECAIYLATGHGNQAETVGLMHTALAEGQSPMPFNFINMATNTAAFHIGQTLGVEGENMTVARDGCAFESALELVWAGLYSGAFGEALVGGVDELTFPVAHHRRRLQLSEEEPVGEGSYWVHVAGTDKAIAEITHLQRYADEASLISAVHSLARCDDYIANGEGCDAALTQRVADACGIGKHFDYRARSGYYGSNAAQGLCQFVEQHPGEVLLHIGRVADAGFLFYRLIVT